MGLRAITGAWKHGMLVDSGGSYLSLCRVVCQSEHVCTWMIVNSGGSDLSLCRVVCQSEHVCTWMLVDSGGSDLSLCRVVCQSEHVCTWMLVDSGGSDLSSCRVVCQSKHVCTWITIRFRKHSGNPEKLQTVLESLEFVWMLVSPLLFLPQSHIIPLI